jgi:hypothetical protein
LIAAGAAAPAAVRERYPHDVERIGKFWIPLSDGISFAADNFVLKFRKPGP